MKEQAGAGGSGREQARAAVRRVALTLLVAFLSPVRSSVAQAVVVGSKPFGESYLLGEMFAQTLEARGIAVERRLGLGATEIAFGAIRSGAIDVYPEYTGTGLVAILGDSSRLGAAQAFDRVANEFARRWGARWLPPLGFENTYAIAVRRETASRYQLVTLTDLARVAPQLTAGLTPDFIGRPDGLPGLAGTYDIRFRAVRSLVPAVKYQALAAEEVDVIDGYATDGFIARYDLVVLADDRRFFPPYQAAALAGARLARRRPDAVLALTALSGRLDEETMRRLNRRIEVDGEPVARVARDALREMGVGVAGNGRERTATEPTGRGQARTLTGGNIIRLTLRHLFLVSLSLGLAIAVAVPAGVLLERLPGGAEAAIRGVGVVQTIPGLALLAFMLPLLGIGTTPAVVALFLYSLYPIVRNTYTGVREADRPAVAAALAAGMTPAQILRYVRLPLAAPVIMAGIRTAAVINVGTATLAALIGAGGLGDPIVAGLALADARMVLSGALPAAALALLVDGALGACERAVRPEM